jgi:hypothetical protein
MKTDPAGIVILYIIPVGKLIFLDDRGLMAAG